MDDRDKGVNNLQRWFLPNAGSVERLLLSPVLQHDWKFSGKNTLKSVDSNQFLMSVFPAMF